MTDQVNLDLHYLKNSRHSRQGRAHQPSSRVMQIDRTRTVKKKFNNNVNDHAVSAENLKTFFKIIEKRNTITISSCDTNGKKKPKKRGENRSVFPRAFLTSSFERFQVPSLDQKQLEKSSTANDSQLLSNGRGKRYRMISSESLQCSISGNFASIPSNNETVYSKRRREDRSDRRVIKSLVLCFHLLIYIFVLFNSSP